MRRRYNPDDLRPARDRESAPCSAEERGPPGRAGRANRSAPPSLWDGSPMERRTPDLSFGGMETSPRPTRGAPFPRRVQDSWRPAQESRIRMQMIYFSNNAHHSKGQTQRSAQLYDQCCPKGIVCGFNSVGVFKLMACQKSLIDKIDVSQK